MQRPVPDVRRLGPGVSYLDGSEQHLLEVMRTASDVSSGSDELDSHIVDWPTRYHLSHQRSNLLRPLRIAEGARVLDVGAGTGALARHLGERGAHVLALEGSMARAEVAAVRCADLPGVEVACGTIDDLDADERFDLIMVIGVLEYSVADIGGGAGAAHLLEAVRSHLAPGGAMALAIENQLGLKYLLGGAEDHRGVPWVGLEDYPGSPGPRTWSRRALATMLSAAGLLSQTWLVPFPDYKLPVAVAHEQLYGEADAALLLDQLVGRPVSFADGPPARLGDAGAAHRVLVEAGLGLDVASSFLVVTARDDAAVDEVVDSDTLAWLYGGHRRSLWRRHRRLSRDRVLHIDRTEAASLDWLEQDPGTSRPYEPGTTLANAVHGALRQHDRDAVAAVLGRWWNELVTRSSSRPVDASEIDHPFLPPWATRVLPDGHLDVGVANFVDLGVSLAFIDDEWRVRGDLSLDLVALRALWVLAHEIVTSGISHPWTVDATVEEVVTDLTAMVPLELPAGALDDLTDAEAQLQHLVSGQSEADVRGNWMLRERSGLDVRPDQQQARELDALRRQVVTLDAATSAMREELAATLPRQVWRGLRRLRGRLSSR